MSNLLKNKLSIEDLKKRANEVAPNELLNTISGGLENACHDTIIRPSLPVPDTSVPCDNV